MLTGRIGRLALLSVGLAVPLGAGTAIAQEVTWASHVAPIMFENCVSCHRPGEIAPMSLLSYDEVRPWARAIKNKVQGREMPPWFPDPRHGTFKNDMRLTTQEIDTIVTWVDAGAPRGDLAELPPTPTSPRAGSSAHPTTSCGCPR